MSPCMLVLTIKAENRMVVTRSPIRSVGASRSARRPQSTKKMVTKICLMRKTKGLREMWSSISHALSDFPTVRNSMSSAAPLIIQSLVDGSRSTCQSASVVELRYRVQPDVASRCAFSQLTKRAVSCIATCIRRECESNGKYWKEPNSDSVTVKVTVSDAI
eukprot:scaffold164744_cov35-Tisochrysis_lutea.AAC.3